MDLMVRVSRRVAAVAVRVAAVLGTIAGAVALPTLLRRAFAPVQPEVVAPSQGEPTEAEPTRPSSEIARSAEDGMVVEDGRSPSSLGRAMAFAHHGFTATVLVFIALAIGTGTYAAVLRPDTAIPKPAVLTIALIFGPTRLASSPITVTLSLGQAVIYSRNGAGTGPVVALTIDLTGRDLAYAGWKLIALVPRGTLNIDPRTGRVSSDAADGVNVLANRGPTPDGRYTATLTWHDLDSGPIRVRGPNLVAEFPNVAVENHTSAGGSGESSLPTPTPTVTVDREFRLASDYAYLAGLPPDHQDRFTWSWKPETGLRTTGLTAVPPLVVEARSATVDEQSHSAEFQSGIFFGVAAAAAIAAIQEFMKSAAGRKRKTHATQTDA